MRFALAHDYLVKYGGAERVLEALLDIFPKAPVFTLLYEPEAMSDRIRAAEIVPSGLNKRPWARNHLNRARFLMPYHVEQFDLSGYDVVISSAHSFIKGLITPPETVHICYCHTPTRYLWHQRDEALQHVGRILRPVLPLGATFFRIWDYNAAQRVDYFIANSHTVEDRIKKFYRRRARVIYPPVHIERFKPTPIGRGAPYLVISRLEPHKRVDLAMGAAKRVTAKLIVAGTGSSRAALEQAAGPTVQFLGFVPDRQIPALFKKSRALIFPQEEDFGIASVEALASGRPVIAYKAGGAEEILSSKTGVFFPEPTVSSLAHAFEEEQHRSWDPHSLSQAAQPFNTSRFQREIRAAVYEYTALVKK